MDERLERIQSIVGELAKDESIAKRGKWIPNKIDGKTVRIGYDVVYECSTCHVYTVRTKNHMIIPMVKDFNYCPMCGARMTEGE